MKDTPLWIHDPLVLFRNENLTLLPSKEQTNTQKVNTITRIIIVLTVIGYMITKTIQVFVVGFISLLLLIFIYFNQKSNIQKSNKESNKESMTPNMKLHEVMNEANGLNTSIRDKINDSSLDEARRTRWYPETSMSNSKQPYNPHQSQHPPATIRIDRADERPRAHHEKPPSQENPLMNVMMTDYKKEPKRPRAEPAFAPTVQEKINKKTKDTIEENLNDKLFKDLGDEIDFDRSMHSFYANPNTQIPNDQKAFAEFCYGNMSSCKDGEVDKCFNDDKRIGQNYV